MNTPHANKALQKGLDEILEPLIDLLIERYRLSEYRNPFAEIGITDGQMYRLVSPCPKSALIELPSRLQDFPPLVSTLAALLQRSGSDDGWFDQEGESDPCRAPLRFCLVKKTLWLPGEDSFSEGGHLMVDAVGFDANAAEKQVALLVAYLKDEANLIELSADDLPMF